MNKSLLMIPILLCLLGLQAQAQTEEQAALAPQVKLTHSGYIDFNYAMTSTKSNDADRYAGTTNFRPFAYPLYDDQFTLNEARYRLNGEVGTTSFLLDFGYGLAPALIAGRAIGTASAQDVFLLQGYISEKLGDSGFAIDAGKMASFLGAEYMENINNPNYSHSYAFSIVPGTHTGLRAKYALNEGQYVVTGHLYNSTQLQSDFDENRNKAMGVSLFAAPTSQILVYAAYLTSKDAVSNTPATGLDNVTFNWMQLDLTFKPIESVDLTIDWLTRDRTADTAGATTTKLTSISAYATYRFVPTTGLTVRYEIYDDNGENSLFSANPANATFKVTSITATLAHNFSSNLMGRLEYRMDSADKDVFVGKDAATFEKDSSAAIAALMMKF